MVVVEKLMLKLTPASIRVEVEARAELDNILIKNDFVFSMKENAEKISITSFLR